MVNKRGWLRIIEAGIGGLIIIGILLVLSGALKSPAEDNYSQKLFKILDMAAKNQDLRNKIIQEDRSSEIEIEDLARVGLGTSGLAFRARVCRMSEDCSLDRNPGNKDIWASERLVSTGPKLNTNFTELKRIKLYAWKER